MKTQSLNKTRSLLITILTTIYLFTLVGCGGDTNHTNTSQHATVCTPQNPFNDYDTGFIITNTTDNSIYIQPPMLLSCRNTAYLPSYLTKGISSIDIPSSLPASCSPDNLIELSSDESIEFQFYTSETQYIEHSITNNHPAILVNTFTSGCEPKAAPNNLEIAHYAANSMGSVYTHYKYAHENIFSAEDEE